MPNFSRSSNCPVVDEEEEAGNDGAGVQSVEDISTENEENETITTPPDELIARELDESTSPATSKTTDKTKVKSSVKAGTSSTASTNVKMNIHLQDSSAKFRMTPAAKKREAMTDAMLNVMQETQKQLTSIEEEDPLDLSFASMAKRMKSNLTPKQVEKVHIAIQNLVNNAIENAEEGLPVAPRPPNLLQPIQTPTPPPAQVNFLHNMPPGPPPPTATPNPVDQNQTGGGDYFQPGPPQLQMYPQYN